MLIFLLLSSCARSISNYLPVRPDDAVEIDGDASDDFKQGWKDGCETGMSAGSNTFYKSFYRNNATDGWKIANSPDYKTAWDNSFWFCASALLNNGTIALTTSALTCGVNDV